MNRYLLIPAVAAAVIFGWMLNEVFAHGPAGMAGRAGGSAAGFRGASMPQAWRGNPQGHSAGQNNGFVGRAGADSQRDRADRRQPWYWDDYAYFDWPGYYDYGYYGPGYYDYGYYRPGYYGWINPFADAGSFGFGPAGIQADIGTAYQGGSQADTRAERAARTRDFGRNETERRPTTEELTARARAAAPRPLADNDVDPASGVLYWPAALQNDSFQPLRQGVQEYTVKWVRYGILDLEDRDQLRNRIEVMYDSLKSQIHDLPPQQYVASRAFLERLLFATTGSLI